MRHDASTTMQRANPGLGLAAALFITLLWAPSAKAVTTITPTPGVCPAAVITQSGDYILGGDVGPCATGDGIDIVASGVTLRLNGHIISGSATPGTCNTSTGIHVGLPVPAPMLTLVRILGPGTISNFQNGVVADNTAGSLAKFVTVTSQCSLSSLSVGFWLRTPSSQWKLQGNIVRMPGNAPAVAIVLGEGFFVAGVSDNDVIGNDVEANVGIALDNSSDNIILNNTASDNFAYGISVGGSSGSNNNDIRANTTDNNYIGVFVVSGSSQNNITGNTSINNSFYDMEDGNANCDSDKWEGNTFGTANQSCIH